MLFFKKTKQNSLTQTLHKSIESFIDENDLNDIILYCDLDNNNKRIDIKFNVPIKMIIKSIENDFDTLERYTITICNTINSLYFFEDIERSRKTLNINYSQNFNINDILDFIKVFVNKIQLWNKIIKLEHIYDYEIYHKFIFTNEKQDIIMKIPDLTSIPNYHENSEKINDLNINKLAEVLKTFDSNVESFMKELSCNNLFKVNILKNKIYNGNEIIGTIAYKNYLISNIKIGDLFKRNFIKKIKSAKGTKGILLNLNDNRLVVKNVKVDNGTLTYCVSNNEKFNEYIQKAYWTEITIE